MFIYYNANVLGIESDDCVARAISLALNIPYTKAIDLLYKNGNKNTCDLLNFSCYEKILNDDLKLFKYNGEGYTISEIANKFPNNKILARCNGHLTCIINNNWYDLFDCGNMKCTDFWIIN